MTTQLNPFDSRKILEFLPHRYPFLLVDKVLELTPGESIKAIKNVSFNEPFFQGHFPGLPVMPGVLILEALAQAGGILVVNALEDASNKVFLFAGIEKVRFRKPVVPGDQLVLHCTDVKTRLKLIRMSGAAYVDGELVAQAQLTAAMLDREEV